MKIMKIMKRKVLKVQDTSSQVIPWRRNAKIKEGWVSCTGWAYRVMPGDFLLLREDGKTKLIHFTFIKKNRVGSDWF